MAAITAAKSAVLGVQSIASSRDFVSILRRHRFLSIGSFVPAAIVSDEAGVGRGSDALRLCEGPGYRNSPDHACRNFVPAFPQRSTTTLSTAAACGGLRSALDCRPKGPPSSLVQLRTAVLLAMPVTYDPHRTWP